MSLFSNVKGFEKYDILQKQSITAQLPDYIKIYCVYQYDRIKFKELLKKAREIELPQTEEELYKLQKKIMKQCYILDEYGNKIRLADEPHIFRYPVLYRLYSEIYKLLNINPEEIFDLKEIGGLIIWKNQYTSDNYEYCGQNYKGQKFTMCGASVKGSENLPLKERVALHIKFLRLLRKGDEIKK